MPAVAPAESHNPELCGSPNAIRPPRLRGPPQAAAAKWSTPFLWGTLHLWGRLSSLRPAFQPALAPLTHCPPRNPMPRLVGADQRVRPSLPISVPLRRPYRQSFVDLSPPILCCPEGASFSERSLRKSVYY